MYPENQQEPNKQSFDEKPIGQGQKMPEMSEYPPDFNPNEIIQNSKPQPLPLQKRVHSKVWKIRKQAFQQLFNQVNQNWSVYQQYLKDTVAFINDSNPMCQQKALKVLLKYLEGARKGLDDPKPILKALIEKCLVVEKGETCNLATQIMFYIMDNHQPILLNEINQNILNKNPKICASVLTFLQRLLNNYGAKKLKQLQQFGKSLTLLSSSVRPVAKQQSINLFKEIFRWMGENAFGFNMHPQVKEEVTKFSKTYVKEPMLIKRGLNQDQKKGKKPVLQSADDDQDLQPQDVLVPFDPRWVDKVLQQPKWKDKKSLLDQFIKKTKAKNIIARQSSHYITLIKRLLSDNNINLLQCGFKVVKNLCCGLKRNFAHPSKVILTLIMSKLRDTKAMIVDQAQQTLQSMTNCLSIDDFLQDIKQGLKDKAPNMRFQTLKFLQRLLMKKDKRMMNAFKNLTAQIIQLNQDGSSQVRDKALDVLCKLKATFGINFFGDRLKKIQDKKLQTIQNYIDPNDNQIDEQLNDQKQKYNQISSKQNQKKPTKSPNQQSNQSMASKSQSVPDPGSKVSCFTPQFQFQAGPQNTRLLTYQNLLQKSAQVINQELIEGFMNRVPMARQSNPTILKLILNCVKKSVYSSVGVEHLELLMHHDWKRCRNLLVQFIQTNKLNLNALQYVKNNGLISQHQSKRAIQGQRNPQREQPNFQAYSQPSLSQQPASIPNFNNSANTSTNSLKQFYSSIQGLIPKMSNPDPIVRLQTAQTALQVLGNIPVGALVESSTQPSAAVNEAISQLFNVLKYRIQDSNQEISNNYIRLITQMLRKGFLTKYRTPGRLLISMLLNRINNPHLTNIKNFIEQMVLNHATILWQFLSSQISKETLCGSVLNIIKNNNQSFFKNADQRAYMLSLLVCISREMEVQRCSELLDQIVQINGEHCLQKIVKQNKINGFNIENYLKKWNIHPSPSCTPHPHPASKPHQSNLLFPQSQVLHSKTQRINSQLEDPWPLTPSPSHILKMMSQMISMGEPFQSLAAPTLLTENQLALVAGFRSDVLEDYSDLIVKWVFWRVNIESSSRNIQALLNLLYRIINLGFQLVQSQVITILGCLISLLTTQKTAYLPAIIRINTSLNQHPLYRQKAFRFWINSFNDPTAPVSQILNLIVNSCSDMIPSEMVTLARYPAVVRNKEFNQYLRANFTEKLLTVYGFKMQDLGRDCGKHIISSGLALNALTEVEAKYYMELFQHTTSDDIIDKIIQETHGIPDQFLMQTHLKIMNSVIVPYLNRQLSFINIYHYFKYLQKIITSSNTQSILLKLVQTLSYFLIDLDQLKLQNFSQLLKTINKLLLILLQITNPKKILQVLFTMLREQLSSGSGSIKLSLLIPKCIGKVIKNQSFRANLNSNSNPNSNSSSNSYQKSVGGGELEFIIGEFVAIVGGFDVGDGVLNRSIRNILMDIIVMFPYSLSIFQDILVKQKPPQRASSLITQLIKQKTKQNSVQTFQKNQNITTNMQSSYVQSKDIKSASNMIKNLKSPLSLGGIQSSRKAHEKQKMGE